jgi:hypothetical protein
LSIVHPSHQKSRKKNSKTSTSLPIRRFQRICTDKEIKKSQSSYNMIYITLESSDEEDEFEPSDESSSNSESYQQSSETSSKSSSSNSSLKQSDKETSKGKEKVVVEP